MEEQYNILWNNNDEIGILNSYDKVKKLRDEHKIICKPFGTSITSRRQNKTLVNPFIISKYDLIYLYNKKLVNFENIDLKGFYLLYDEREKDIKYLIYNDLKNKGYYIIPGNNYGVDFLVYKDDPNFVHSQFLVNCYEKNENINIKEIISNERIGWNTKKKLLYGFVEIENKQIDYIDLSWFQI
jgi:tRNA-intron lyase